MYLFLASVLFPLKSAVVLPLLQWEYNKTLTTGRTEDTIETNAPLINCHGKYMS